MAQLIFWPHGTVISIKYHLGSVCFSAIVGPDQHVSCWYLQNPSPVADYERAGWKVREIE